MTARIIDFANWHSRHEPRTIERVGRYPAATRPLDYAPHERPIDRFTEILAVLFGVLALAAVWGVLLYFVLEQIGKAL